MDVQELLTDLIDAIALLFITIALIDFVMPLVLRQKPVRVENPKPSVFDLFQELEQSEPCSSQEMEITESETCRPINQSPIPAVTATIRNATAHQRPLAVP